MSIALRAVIVAMTLLGAEAGAAEASKPPITQAKPGTDTGDTPYAKVLNQLVKKWPSDLKLDYMQSSGGIPPFVTLWHVDAKGIGKAERTFDDAGHPNPENWPVALQLADVKALLTALCAVDFEHVPRPAPDSPAQFLSIRSGGRTETLDLNGLVPPGTPAAVQEKVSTALDKLLVQARKTRPIPPPK